MSNPEPQVAAAPGVAQQSVSEALAAFAAATAEVPARIAGHAKLHMLDVIGTALAATQFDFAHRALAG